MPFYLGKGSGIVFTSETRPGTVLNLFADEWGVEIKDESINITSIKPLRDKNVINDLAAVPAWRDFGIPMQMLNGGLRETVITMHGFLFYDNTVSVNDDARIPIINERGKLEIKYSNNAGIKKNLFKADSVVVISSKFDMSVTGALEYDIEFNVLTTDIDYVPHPAKV
jgi:hypothetical protein